MAGRTTPQNPRLFELMSSVLGTALEYVEKRERKKQHVSTHSEWPSVNWNDHGMPSFSHNLNAPKDYADALRAQHHLFNSDDEPIPEFRNEESFKDLAAFIRSDQRLSKYLRADLDIFETSIEVLVGNVTDRYIHTTGLMHFDAERFMPTYLQIENVMLSEKLSAALLVPILFLRMPIKQLRLHGSAQIVRLSEPLQLARAPNRLRYGEHALVQACATHALALGRRDFSNEDWLSFGHVSADPQQYPIKQVDTFFAALRIATGHKVGYAQILLRPIDWASWFRATLPPIVSTTVRAYPPEFENYSWNQSVPILNSTELAEIAIVYKRLMALTNSDQNPRLQLALKRLNGAALRTDEEDKLVDIAIAFEALLSDGTQEMTFKISLRAAALAGLKSKSTPTQVFEEMKQIYSFRSAVVHGDAAQLKKRRIIRRGSEMLATCEVALEHLRTTLAILVTHPKYLEVKDIDYNLLLSRPT